MLESHPQTRSRLLLKDRAYSGLKKLILGGHYPPGTFLSERLLVEEMKMSKTPIRAALELLESEGFVSVSPQQGILVREPSLREVVEQFEIRFALESYVLRTLAGRLTLAQQGRGFANLEAQREAAERGDLERSIHLDGEFHVLMCEFVGNREILNVIQRLREKIFWVISMVFRQDERRMLPNWQEHEKIFQAVVEGQSELAVQYLEMHFEYGKRALF